MAYDAWGKRLRDTGVVDTTVDPVNGNRGYTGHEHIDELQLVHMNGRVYDPVLARFFSPDSYVENPYLLQSYSSYAYVLNNPLKYTDASGHCIWDYCVAEIVAFAVGYQLATQGNQYWAMVGQVMMMWAGSSLVEAGLGVPNAQWYDAPVGNAFNVGGYGNAFLTASITNYSLTGNAESAVKSGLFAVAFSAIGGASIPDTSKVMLHAFVGCVQGAINSGGCGPSAIAAGFGKWSSLQMKGMQSEVRIVATMVAGGTASVIGGGKFANGAFQAGFAEIFNGWAHSLKVWQMSIRLAPIACASGPLVCTGYVLSAAVTGAAAGLLLNEATDEMDSVGPKIHDGQQGKHVPGHNNFQPGKSELTDPDPQGLLDQGTGTGQQVGNTPVGQSGSKERVDFGKRIGNYVDPVTGEKSPTSIGIIHHGSRGSHIVPARPGQ
jgi:RHS repeat-associated protein